MGMYLSPDDLALVRRFLDLETDRTIRRKTTQQAGNASSSRYVYQSTSSTGRNGNTAHLLEDVELKKYDDDELVAMENPDESPITLDQVYVIAEEAPDNNEHALIERDAYGTWLIGDTF